MHPLRLRILNALEGRRLAPREIGALMPEVSQATLYRHIARLHSAGLITVAEERAVGGTTERVFTAVREELTLSHADLKDATREEIGDYIRAFVGMLLEGFDRYLRQRAPVRTQEDGVGFIAEGVYLSDDEYADFRTRMRELLAAAERHEPAEGRRRRTLAFIAIPDPRDEEDEDAGNRGESDR